MRASNSDTAIDFAIRAHINSSNITELFQVMIIGDILKIHGFSDNIVSAAYLFKTVSNTNYNHDDMMRIFSGKYGRYSSLILTTIDLNEKKLNQLKTIRGLSLESRALIAATAIAKLESERIKLKNQDEINLALLENQGTYYKQLLDVLEEESGHPIFDSLYECIGQIYYGLPGENIANEINQSLTDRLTILRHIFDSSKSFIIDFNSNNEENISFQQTISDFLKEDTISLKVLDEPSLNHVHDKNGISRTEARFIIASEIENTGLLSEIVNDNNLLLIDQGLYNRLIWLKLLIKRGGIWQEKAEEYIKYYLPKLVTTINYVRLPYTKAQENINDYASAKSNLVKLLDGETVLPNVSRDEQALTVYQVVDRFIPIISLPEVKKLRRSIQKDAA